MTCLLNERNQAYSALFNRDVGWGGRQHSMSKAEGMYSTRAERARPWGRLPNVSVCRVLQFKGSNARRATRLSSTGYLDDHGYCYSSSTARLSSVHSNIMFALGKRVIFR